MYEPQGTQESPEIVDTTVCVFAGNFWSEGPELSCDSQRDSEKKKRLRTTDQD